MATSNRMEKDKVETYARTLLEAARAEGREKRDLRALDGLADALGELSDTLKVILERGDEQLLPDIAQRYSALFHAEVDVVAVDVTTAIPLEDDLREEVEEFLTVEYDKPVFVVEHVDPSIIGGIIFNARGERRDASVRTQLENARRVLKAKGGE